MSDQVEHEEKKSGGAVGVGMRFLALLLALVLAFAVAVLVVAGLDIADAPICDSPEALTATECYDGGSLTKTIGVILLAGGAIFGAIAALCALGVALGAALGRWLAISLGIAVVLTVLSFLIA